MDKQTFHCPNCKDTVEKDDDFCPNCGTLFSEDIFCKNHPKKPAAGVCVICTDPFCAVCGGTENDIFRCNSHADYEIVQGHAKILGTDDLVLAEFVKSCLEKQELHPQTFNRRSASRTIEASMVNFFRAGESAKHSVNEIKIMVPFQEVDKCEKILPDILKGM